MDTAQVEPFARLRTLIVDDPVAVDAYLATLSGSDVVRAMFRLGEDERQAILSALSPETAAEFIEDVPDDVAADLIEGLPVEDAASIMTALPSHERADVLAEVEDEDRLRILGALAPETAADARELMTYAAESAGGLMVRDFLSFPASASAREVLEDLTSGDRELSPNLVRFAYAVNAEGRLIGMVRTRSLVAAPPSTAIRSVMAPATAINAEADLVTIDACLDEAEVESLPVTDDDGTLLGVVDREHVDEALADRAVEDHLKSQGIIGGEELRSMPLGVRSRRRLSWLSINIVLNLIAASVIAAFEETLAALIALAVFLPIVSDMSGCSGNQAVAISMRELALGVTSPRDVLRVWWQEAKVGVLNGIALGVLLGAIAWLWKGALVGALVAFALAVNTLVAVSIGGTVPLLLKRFGADPAVASGPVLTTVTDLCGFFLLLGTATLAITWL